jgi:tetratricopeptide (TPR) repeat protein
MNWEQQLAVDIRDSEKALMPNALKARNLCRQNKYGAAMEVLWHMLRDARRSGSRKQEAFVLIHIGKVYRNWLWDVALKFYRDGLAVAQSCGFKRGEMTAYNAIGELYYAWGNQQKALAHYRKSLQTACALHDPSSQRDILLDMIDSYEECGEIDTCEELLQEAIRLDEEMGAIDLSGPHSGLRVVSVCEEGKVPLS